MAGVGNIEELEKSELAKWQMIVGQYKQVLVAIDTIADQIWTKQTDPELMIKSFENIHQMADSAVNVDPDVFWAAYIKKVREAQANEPK